ncbi:MAG: hypothetical protein CYPHOPRED_000762 [Cyphobasidiales sp. Tagirdzhanova-0007]|nr:MAG: hypothetical protein CYPHOPRED_000762 [Cyphobasidiales sp. Tagirdzhanova-0007]
MRMSGPKHPATPFSIPSSFEYFEEVSTIASPAPVIHEAALKCYGPTAAFSTLEPSYCSPSESPRINKYGNGLGLGSGAPFTKQPRNSSYDSARSIDDSASFNARRPSLRIADMPALILTGSLQPSNGRLDAADPSSLKKPNDSDVTPLKMSSLSLERAGSMQRSAHFTMSERSELGEDSDTPRVSTFAMAIRQAKRKATPYPSSKGAYFEASETENADDDNEYVSEESSGDEEWTADQLAMLEHSYK